MKRGQSEAEALNSQWKNALTRSIGSDGEVVVDVFGPFPIHDQDALLLCSDGLYKSLGDDEIRATVVASRGTEDAARSLVAAALGAGSDDNVTVALTEFGDFLRAEDGGAAADEEPEAPQVDVVAPTPWWMVWRR
jgi:serine/threonine protein phosphatase PrpC